MSSFYDLASLIMIPSGKKAGKVYSQKPLSTDGQLDFTRASTATRIGSDGLIEKTRTNSLLNTNTFSSWALEGGSITGGFSAPDGTLTASKYVPSGSSGLFSTVVFTDSLVKTVSIYVKSVDGTSYNVTIGNGVNAGVISKTVTSIWQRISVTPTTTTSAMSLYLYGIGNVNGLLFGILKGEHGTVATDYIPTTSAAVSVGSVDNMPRLNYTPGSATSCPSLLLEPQRTNLIPQSEYFGGSDWTLVNATILSNATTSPEGVINASKWIASSGLSLHNLYQIASVASGVPHTASGYFKAQEYPLAFLRLGGVTGNPYVIYDLRDQSTVSTAGLTSHDIQSVGNGWYRIIATATTTTTILAPNLCFLPESGYTLDAGNNPSFNGDGTSGGYLYGAQLEEGSYATSYIPTFGATVTRVADACSKTGITSLIGQTEGTWFLELSSLSDIVVNEQISLSDGSDNNTIKFVFGSAVGGVKAEAKTGAVGQFGITKSTSDYTSTKKIAIAYKANDFVFYYDGVLIGSDTSGSVPAMSAFSFAAGLTIFPANIKLNQALLFKTRLSNTQLAELTSIES